MVVNSKKYRPVLWSLAAMAMFQPVSVAAQCRLCTAAPGGSTGNQTAEKPEKPLQIQITTNLDFSRLALLDRSGGEIHLDPQSRERRVSGSLRDLGGLSLHGEGRLTGEPGRLVKVQMPERIILSAPNGSTAELVRLDTNLSAQPRLDRDGHLKFLFGGRLRVNGNVSGQFRGRIAITAEYE